MTAKVFRFNPLTDKEPYFQEYEIGMKITPEDHVSVMALLEYIADNLDGTLSFFSHSACLHGICGRCGVKLNGKACLACQTVLDGGDVVIEPMKKDIVKDLVTR